MFIDMNRAKRREVEREMTHDELVRTQIGGPANSPVDKGAGITEEIGPNAARMIETMMRPQFIEQTFGPTPHLIAQARREGLKGIARGGDMQYFAAMPYEMFVTLMWTDPTLFQDEKRLEAYLIKSGLAVPSPR